jgi:hypothetical protein
MKRFKMLKFQDITIILAVINIKEPSLFLLFSGEIVSALYR